MYLFKSVTFESHLKDFLIFHHFFEIKNFLKVTCALIEKLEKTNKSVELDNFKKNFSTKDENKLIIARNIIVEQGIEEDCLKFQV